MLYEGTGRHGYSSVREVRVEDGQIVRSRRLSRQYFGEGITVLNGSLIQLTRDSQTAFVYDLESLELRRTFRYTGEGWGLTHDGEWLIMSDGSAVLRFIDSMSWCDARALTVRDGREKVVGLNALAFAEGEILANVYPTERVARISPVDGRVRGWIDFHGLLPPEDAAGTGVANGIAYDASGRRFFVTGKLWPRLFAIRLIPPGSPNEISCRA
jgi:glutamine cyclotransferase